jgi:hypothetical protein
MNESVDMARFVTKTLSRCKLGIGWTFRGRIILKNTMLQNHVVGMHLNHCNLGKTWTGAKFGAPVNNWNPIATVAKIWTMSSACYEAKVLFDQLCSFPNFLSMQNTSNITTYWEDFWYFPDSCMKYKRAQQNEAIGTFLGYGSVSSCIQEKETTWTSKACTHSRDTRKNLT